MSQTRYKVTGFSEPLTLSDEQADELGDRAVQLGPDDKPVKTPRARRGRPPGTKTPSTPPDA